MCSCKVKKLVKERKGEGECKSVWLSETYHLLLLEGLHTEGAICVLEEKHGVTTQREARTHSAFCCYVLITCLAVVV